MKEITWHKEKISASNKSTVNKLFFLLLAGLMSMNIQAHQKPFKTLNFLYGIQGQYTVGGQHNKEPNSEPLLQSTRLYTKTSKWPALHSNDFLFRDADVQNRSTMIQEVVRQWELGAIIQLMWHACSPTQAPTCEWEEGVKTTITDAQWDDLLSETGELNRIWKARMDDVAVFLKELESKGVEVLFRPLHEMNQSEFWWGGRPGDKGSSRLFQMTHDYFVYTKGLTNLVWVWNLQDFNTLTTDVDAYDPGSAYWDMLSLDVYYSDGKGYEQRKYDTIRAKAQGKLIAIGETEDLPSPNLLKEQPDWTFFMGWAELTFNNADDKLIDIFNANRVITRDEMPGWGSVSADVIQGEDYSNSAEGVEKRRIEDGIGEMGSAVIIDAWEWVSFDSVNIESAGKYTLAFRIKTDVGVTFQAEEAGAGVIASFTVPTTGGKWVTVYKVTEYTQGTHAIGIKVTEGSMDLDWMSLSSKISVASMSARPAPGETPVAIPTPHPLTYPVRIEAESNSNNSGGLERLTEADEGDVMASFGAWEWMSFDGIVLPKAMEYIVSYRVKSSADASLNLEKAGQSVLATTNIASTQGEWQTVSHSLFLPAGPIAFGLKVTDGEISLNWFDIDCEGCSGTPAPLPTSAPAPSTPPTPEPPSAKSPSMAAATEASGGGSVSLMMIVLFGLLAFFRWPARCRGVHGL